MVQLSNVAERHFYFHNILSRHQRIYWLMYASLTSIVLCLHMGARGRRLFVNCANLLFCAFILDYFKDECHNIAPGRIFNHRCVTDFFLVFHGNSVPLPWSYWVLKKWNKSVEMLFFANLKISKHYITHLWTV